MSKDCGKFHHALEEWLLRRYTERDKTMLHDTEIIFNYKNSKGFTPSADDFDDICFNFSILRMHAANVFFPPK